MSLTNSTYILGRRILDAELLESIALPAAATDSVSTGVIDLDEGSARTDLAQFPENVDVVIQIPALTVGMLPNTDTLTVTLLNDNNTTPTTTVATYVITGASGAGAPANEFHFKLPPGCGRYLMATAVSGSGTGNMSSLDMVLALGF